MFRTFSEYTNVFFWDFKRMDNANYNFDILVTLCTAKKSSSSNPHFNRPILIQIVAIIECTLYDFVRRVNGHRGEIIPNIDQTTIENTRTKTLDEFEPLIAHVRKNNLFRCSAGDPIYNDLDTLRRIRNRVHIQDRQQQLDRDEYKVWTNDNIELAGKILERIIEVLCHVYPRPKRDFVSITDFPRPWR